MIYFLDTSALFKLYHEEEFSGNLKAFLADKDPDALVISRLARIEFDSIVWRKVRSKQPDALLFDEKMASYTTSIFENDLDLYHIMPFEDDDIEDVRRLLNRVNRLGNPLRSLDAIQLLIALKTKEFLDGFICFDRDLAEAARSQGLTVLDRTFFSASA